MAWDFKINFEYKPLPLVMRSHIILGKMYFEVDREKKQQTAAAL